MKRRIHCLIVGNIEEFLEIGGKRAFEACKDPRLHDDRTVPSGQLRGLVTQRGFACHVAHFCKLFNFGGCVRLACLANEMGVVEDMLSLFDVFKLLSACFHNRVEHRAELLGDFYFPQERDAVSFADSETQYFVTEDKLSELYEGESNCPYYFFTAAHFVEVAMFDNSKDDYTIGDLVEVDGHVYQFRPGHPSAESWHLVQDPLEKKKMWCMYKCQRTLVI